VEAGYCTPVTLPLSPPIPPMLARPSRGLPDEDGVYAYEPKWDGFRVIAFVDGDEVELRSRNDKPLNRYFPELRFPHGRYVLDGEIVVRDGDGGIAFGALQQRIHPAASRVERMSAETPAVVVAFDLLSLDDEVLLERTFAERRALLEQLVPADSVELCPQVRTAEGAERWLHEYEGVIAKRLDALYLPGERKGMQKVRRQRTLDCVVAGYRPGKAEGTIGSIMLGLYDGQGNLHVIGHSSGFSAKEKRQLLERFGPLETGERGTAEPSRWTAGRDLEWVALEPVLVVEVTYDHASDGRIRHGASVVRWRTDRDPKSCLLEQLDI
jgi:ATP-dependent DNA ligase